MTIETRFMTAEELLALPEDEALYELFDGEPIPLQLAELPRIMLTSRLHEALVMHLHDDREGAVWGGDVGFLFGRNPDTVLCPNLSVVAAHELAKLVPGDWGFPEIVPAIVIEVKSPSDREADIARKLAVYLRAGVPLVWWVRPEARTVSVHRPDAPPTVLDEAATLAAEDVLPGFALPLAELFR